MASNGAMFHVRQLTETDCESAGGVLAHAFVDDPQFVYGIPVRAKRVREYPLFFAYVSAYACRYGTVWGVSPSEGALVGIVNTIPAPEAEFTRERLAEIGFDLDDPFLGPLTGRLQTAEADAIEQLAIAFPEPHVHLFQLGVHPEWQGQGLGQRLVRTVVEHAARQGRRVCLNTSSASNVAFYTRCGLVQVGQGTAGVGIPWWTFGTANLPEET
jgi:ribosomal protein S18 acetylase RimI-like enzyme